MPRVPVYESKVRTEALPTPKVSSVGNGLGELAKGIGEVGSAVESISADMERTRREEEKFLINRFMERYEDREKDLFYGDTGLFRANGEAVYETGLDEATRNDLSFFAKTLTEEAPEGIRETVRAKLADRFRASDTNVLKYSISQREVAKRAAFERRVDGLVRRMDSGAFVPDGEIIGSLSELSSFAPSREHVKSVTTDLLLRNAEANIRGLLKADKIEEAEAELKKNREQLGKRAGVLDGEIADVRNDRLISTGVRKVIDSFPYTFGNDERTKGWIDNAKAVSAWNKELLSLPPALADKANAAFAHEVARRDSARKALISSYWQSAHVAYGQKRMIQDISSETKSFLSKHDAEEWNRFEKANQDYWRRLRAEDEKRERLRNKGGEQEVKNYEASRLAEVRIGIAAQPEHFGRMTPDEFRSVWGPDLGSMTDEGLKLYSTHASKWTTDPNYQSKVRASANAIDVAMGESGLKPGTARYKELAADLRSKLASNVAVANEAGLTPKQDELNTLAREHVLAAVGGKPKGNPFGSKTRAPVVPAGTKPPPAPAAPAPTPAPAPVPTEATGPTTVEKAMSDALFGGPSTSAHGSKVPADVRMKIVDSFRAKKNREPTEAEIERIYAKVSSKGVAP